MEISYEAFKFTTFSYCSRVDFFCQTYHEFNLLRLLGLTALMKLPEWYSNVKWVPPIRLAGADQSLIRYSTNSDCNFLLGSDSSAEMIPPMDGLMIWSNVFCHNMNCGRRSLFWRQMNRWNLVTYSLNNLRWPEQCRSVFIKNIEFVEPSMVMTSTRRILYWLDIIEGLLHI